MSYNSALDELYFADSNNQVIRKLRLRNNNMELRDVYRWKDKESWVHMHYVCYMSHSDTLLVSLYDINYKKSWLVALSRKGRTWREAHRVLSEFHAVVSWLSCAQNDSRVLIGSSGYMYFDLFHVNNDHQIDRIQRISINSDYRTFAANFGNETLVAMSDPNTNEVRVYRLRGDHLEEVARTKLHNPEGMLWLADRLLVADLTGTSHLNSNHQIIELELSGRRLERKQLLVTDKPVVVWRWCAVGNDAIAIYDFNNGQSEYIQHYKL